MSAANVISISNVSNIPDNERGPLLKEFFAAHCSGRSVLTTLRVKRSLLLRCSVYHHFLSYVLHVILQNLMLLLKSGAQSAAGICFWLCKHCCSISAGQWQVSGVTWGRGGQALQGDRSSC